MYIELIKAYIEDEKRMKKLSKLLEDEWIDSYVIPKPSALQEYVHKLLKDKFGEYFWDDIYEYIDKGFIFEYDHEEALAMGYLKDTIMQRGEEEETWFIVHKDVDITKAKSYKELSTIEEILGQRRNYSE